MNAFVDSRQFPAPLAAPSGFVIGAHDRITIEGKAFRRSGTSGANVVLCPADGHGLTEQFPMSVLSRLSAMGKIKHEVGYYLPDVLQSTTGVAKIEMSLGELSSAARDRVGVRHAIVQAVEELIGEGRLKKTDDDIKAKRSEIERRVPAFMVDLPDSHTMEEQDARQNGKEVRARKGNKLELKVKLPSNSTIRKMVDRYRRHGIVGLADRLSRSGNHSSSWRPEELSLLTRTIRESYLTLERKTIAATVLDVERAFARENERRKGEELSVLRVPGRDAVRNHIKKLDQLVVLIARYGEEEAIKRLRPVTTGPEVGRPLERVEMDEWKIDLHSIFSSSNLTSAFDPEFLNSAGLTERTGRWWLVVAIDCRTRVILGMKLARDPSTSSALETLRTVLTDKGEWADAVGALSPWSQFGPPQTLVTDNGAGFKSQLFTSACTDLGIGLTRTIAGMPTMRGTVERFFRTASIKLMERLIGRSFGNLVEKGEHPSEKRACLDADDLAFALVRWIVDIYHNTPHLGLGGLTPLEQWEADMRDGNYPLRACPDSRLLRLAFGRRRALHVSKAGITVMGVKYHSQMLAASFLHGGSTVVDIRWDPENLGAIEALIDGTWHEVPAVHDRFDGVRLADWVKARRALQAISAGRKTWNEAIVFKALDDIEALVARKSAAAGLIERPMSDKELLNLERSLFSGFDIKGPAPAHETDDGLGRMIAPRKPDPEMPPQCGVAAPADATRAPVIGTEAQRPARKSRRKTTDFGVENSSVPAAAAQPVPSFKICIPGKDQQ